MNLQELKMIARCELDANGLTDWTFKFGKAYNNFGTCFHSKKTIHMSRILSELNDETACINTLKHEIAHALAGPKHDEHDDVWREICLSLGGDGEAFYSLGDTKHIRKYLAYCPTCPRGWTADFSPVDAICVECLERGVDSKIIFEPNRKHLLKFPEDFFTHI